MNPHHEPTHPMVSSLQPELSSNKCRPFGFSTLIRIRLPSCPDLEAGVSGELEFWGVVSLKRSLELAALTLSICLGTENFASGQIAIDVNPTLPSDIAGAGGAPAATLQQAAAFAWQEFIALNWPAMAGQRDVADKG
jgi:hypothetical protein